ncbi:MAG: hypothetical protein OXU42_14615 [Deltaproteobacteria bacterium]|nr:hypothetical protein [Deltaproteobacteria bacterium]
MDTLTTETVAAALRLDAPLSTELETQLTRLMAVGSALVDLYASEAPEAVRTEAVIRVVAYLFDQPESPHGTRYSAAWRNSGAAALVGPWIVRGASVITAGKTTTPTGGTDAILTALQQQADTLAAVQGELVALRSRLDTLEGV